MLKRTLQALTALALLGSAGAAATSDFNTTAARLLSSVNVTPAPCADLLSPADLADLQRSDAPAVCAQLSDVANTKAGLLRAGTPSAKGWDDNPTLGSTLLARIDGATLLMAITLDRQVLIVQLATLLSPLLPTEAELALDFPATAAQITSAVQGQPVDCSSFVEASVIRITQMPDGPLKGIACLNMVDPEVTKRLILQQGEVSPQRVPWKVESDGSQTTYMRIKGNGLGFSLYPDGHHMAIFWLKHPVGF